MKNGRTPESTSFDEQQVTLVLDDGVHLDVYAERVCSDADRFDHHEANITFVTSSLTAGIYCIPAGELRALGKFLFRYARRLETIE